MARLKQTLLVFVLLTFVSMASFEFVTSDVYAAQVASYVLSDDSSDECMQPFDEFAYGGPPFWSNRQPVTLSNWQLESPLPPSSDNILQEYPAFSVELARTHNGEQEIWVRGRRSQEEGPLWLIYKPDTQEWESIPRMIGDTNLYSRELFLASDGTIWASTVWIEGAIALENVPVLSKLDDDARHFVFEESAMEIPLVQERHYGALYVLPWPLILLDEQDTFWVFVNYDGLYSYNPDTNTVEKHADITEYPIDNAALAPNGNLFFSRPTNQVGSTRAVFGLSKGMLFQFDPELNEISTLTIPDGDWPGFNGMLVDRDGVLRLGATSYRMPNGDWNLMPLNLEAYFDNAGDYLWATPNLLLESSDGRLWYNRYLDGSGGGTAWYDVETGNGCLFNGEASNIIEDTNQQLWMIANGNLYRYSLNSTGRGL
ncbi:MAG: hypothetical protein K8L99_31180 [Anaerolineae bacterium]|nr:hypothetical protein [Anaerolineae bacterium]